MTIEFYPRKPWFYLILLFQSHRQALSWVATLAATLTLVYFVSAGLSLKGMSPYVLVASVVIGSAFSLVFALPFRLNLNSAGNNVEQLMLISIEASGYKSASQPGIARGKSCYMQVGPEFLRWMESNIVVSRTSGQLTIDGPLLMLLKLRSVALKAPKQNI